MPWVTPRHPIRRSAKLSVQKRSKAPKKKGKKKGGKRARLGQRGLENEKRK